MKKLRPFRVIPVGFLAVAFVLCLNVPAWADAIQLFIVVDGTAIAEVTPNEMAWSLNVINKGQEAEVPDGQKSDILLSTFPFRAIDQSRLPLVAKKGMYKKGENAFQDYIDKHKKEASK